MAFRNARLTAELSGEIQQLADRTVELTESRRRLISARDEERSRLELAITRQVVLHLAPLPDRLRELSRLATDAPDGLDTAMLRPLVESVNAALAALREITRGVFPAQLARAGLPAALGSFLAGTQRRGQLIVDDLPTDRRFDPWVESAAYFCVVEATGVLVDPVVVELTELENQLRLVISGRHGDGPWIDHVRDRVEAAGGSVSMTSGDGHAVVEARLPVQGRLRVA
jgi:signal transduction histidine kinase